MRGGEYRSVKVFRRGRAVSIVEGEAVNASMAQKWNGWQTHAHRLAGQRIEREYHQSVKVFRRETSSFYCGRESCQRLNGVECRSITRAKPTGNSNRNPAGGDVPPLSVSVPYANADCVSTWNLSVSAFPTCQSRQSYGPQGFYLS
jgi:hypothetical protein